MGFDNGAVDAAGEPEIIRVEDQPPQRASLAGDFCDCRIAIVNCQSKIGNAPRMLH
jgi:hypothetical protein